MHRDLKPENIMISASGPPSIMGISPSEVKLIDFGLAGDIYDSEGIKI